LCAYCKIKLSFRVLKNFDWPKFCYNLGQYQIDILFRNDLSVLSSVSLNKPDLILVYSFVYHLELLAGSQSPPRVPVKAHPQSQSKLAHSPSQNPPTVPVKTRPQSQSKPAHGPCLDIRICTFNVKIDLNSKHAQLPLHFGKILFTILTFHTCFCINFSCFMITPKPSWPVY
jgi:hypothetical protein